MKKGGKASEFVLYSNNKELLIVELKGQNVDLDKPQKNHRNQTPVEQGWEYLPKREAEWLILSNYDEFRLYNQRKNEDEFISFNFNDLLDPLKFSQFMVCFSKKSHIDRGYPDILLKETILIEEDIEDNFYSLYHQTRLMLIKELEDKNINGFETKKAVKYAQTILNRYMFICFAEDINDLLPSQISTETIYSPINEYNISKNTIWSRLNDLFGFINYGNQFKYINKYNGGIFKEDLRFIEIRDIVEDPEYFKEEKEQKWDLPKYSTKIEKLMGEHGDKINPIYWNLLTISNINFESDFDVNILGHIFENSIGDLEDLKEGKKGIRKIDGIFYTPPEVTDYICRNTIIPYLSKSGKSTNVNELISEYYGQEINDLDEKLRKIKIIDPACGSGAFLNKAVDVLLEIHNELHNQMYENNSSLDKHFDSIAQRREILKENIYGVDLNEESVEITKLSMFLKVAHKGSMLPDIDKNIKCGNSLINSPQEGSKNEFTWENAFPQIFEEGRFDIVIGNPPYGISFKEKEKEFLEIEYPTFKLNNNYYVAFTEKGISLTKNKGMFAYIIPNTFLVGEYFNNLKKYILSTTNVWKILDFGKYPVFRDPSVFSSIIILKKEENSEINLENKFEFIEILEKDGFKTNNVKLTIENQSDLEDLNWVPKSSLVHKMNNITPKLDDIAFVKDVGFNYWTKGRGKKRGGSIGSRVLYEGKQENPKDIPYLKGRDFNKYGFINEPHNWLKHDYKTYLNPKVDTFRFSPEFLENPQKIIYRQTSDRIIAHLDTNQHYLDKTVHLIVLKDEFKDKFDINYVLAIINSKLATYFYKENVKEEGQDFAQVKTVQMKKIPICNATNVEQIKIAKKVKIRIHLNKILLKHLETFKNWLVDVHDLENSSKKLGEFYKLSSKEFIDELKEKNKKLKKSTPKHYNAIIEGYNETIDVITPLIQKINENDNEINAIVNKIYGLTEDEIKIIEDNYKN